jgi:1-acyl-sn-glycerol-3-phosphate acyltransferase
MPSSFGYGLSVLLVRVFLTPFTRRRVIGALHIPRCGACILAPNHISHFDPPLIGISTSRPVDWMAMQELFSNRIFGGILRWIGSFPVGREKFDRAAVRTALDRLKRGRLVGVFPEGGLRTGPESVLEGAPLKPGVAAMAQMTGATVVPCVVIGSDALYAPRQWLPFRHTRIWVVFGPPLSPPAAEGDKDAARENFETLLGDTLRELYARTVREENIPAECLPQTPQRRKGQS